MSIKQMKRKYIWFIFAFIMAVLAYMIGSGCPQQAFLGISCMGCGMTRAYLSLLHGDIRNAFFYHPAFWTVPIATVLLVLQKRLSKKSFYLGIGCIIIIFIIIYIYRILCHDPVLIFDIKKGYIYKIWKSLRQSLNW